MPAKKKKSKDTDKKNYTFGGHKNDDSDDEGGDLIEIMNNHIYFYSDVNNKSAFELTKAFEKVKLEIQGLKAKYGVEPIIHLHIKSDGGCIFSAFCIIDVMRKIQNEGFEIYTYCEGSVASAGTMISIHGNRRFMSRNALMLIHQLSSMFWGKFAELEDDWENCNMLMKKIKKMYKDNCKFKKRELDNILKHDLWFEADKCLALSLIDEII